MLILFAVDQKHEIDTKGEERIFFLPFQCRFECLEIEKKRQQIHGNRLRRLKIRHTFCAGSLTDWDRLCRCEMQTIKQFDLLYMNDTSWHKAEMENKASASKMHCHSALFHVHEWTKHSEIYRPPSCTVNYSTEIITQSRRLVYVIVSHSERPARGLCFCCCQLWSCLVDVSGLTLNLSVAFRRASCR